MTLNSARPSGSPHELPAASLATDRFQVVRKLGAGGMATVHEVLDRATGRRLALKRLHPEDDPKRRRRVLELFEREFHTLSQIAHPRVVEAYDYGIDDHGAYFTMELLEGGELQGLAPVPYDQACRIGQDICSVLALLHSRRLLYRDLNPRNVHCTSDGSAKLIDFGGTTLMGPSRQVVGTPAYCAPEALDLQPLDARTDLYSLGATLYFMLTGRHVYPARTFAQLHELWEIRPARPSEIVADVPPALDALVMDLLHLDPSLRPSNASEVMEQLAAIGGRPVEEHLQVKQSYLATPTLVGRDAPLARVRAKLLRMMRGFGSALLLTGSSGVGRTRLLGACLLEAKLQGALVLRADASDASEDYGVVRALAENLLESAAELGARCAEPGLTVLGHVVPELVSGRPELQLATFEDANRERAVVLAALREWISAVAAQRPVLLAIDDLHELDEPSAAFLALCAHESSQRALSVIATYDADASASAPDAVKLFDAAATSMPVTNLTATNTEDLLRSVFGDVPQVQAVAHKLHALSHGNPRDTLALAQYLVDRGIARYRSGGWTLPASFDTSDLPADMAHALRVQVESLPPKARELASLVSLATDRDLGFEELLGLYPELPTRRLHDQLDELIAAQVLERNGERFRIGHPGFHVALRQLLPEHDRQRLDRMLAQLFAARGSEEFRRARHLFRAGEAAGGLDVLIQHARDSQALTDSQPLEYLKLVQSMPDEWFSVYTRAIELCAELERPQEQVFVLRNRLAGLVNVMGTPSTLSHPQLLELVNQLARDAALEDYAALDPALGEAERLKRAFQSARQRREAASERTRGLDPGLAVNHLIRTQIACAGMAAIAFDYDFWSRLPSLRPLAPLSPAVPVMEDLIAGVGARIGGRTEDAITLYRRLLERCAQPDLAGIEASSHRFLVLGVMSALGVVEAGMGLASCLRWADEITAEPLHTVNAYQIRVIHELWQGRVRDADRLREQVELLRIQSSPRQLGDGLHLTMQVVAHALSDDLTRLKHAMDEIRVFVQRHPAWEWILQYAQGEYQRIRGDYVAAEQLLRTAATAVQPGRHQIWPFAAGAYIHVLGLLGRHDEACAFGQPALEAAQRAGLRYAAHYIRMPLAVELAELGEASRAVELADSVIHGMREIGSDGLSLVLAYEARARIAVRTRDVRSYETFATLCNERCRAAGSRVLGAKYERLVRAATTAEVHVPQAAPDHVLATLTGTQLTSVLVGCDKPSERAERALQLLLRRSGTEVGYLYLMGEHGPVLAAVAGGDPPTSLPAIVSEFIDRELQDRELTTRSLEDEEAPSPNSLWPSEQGGAHRLVLLSHQLPEGFAVTGVAAMVVEPGAPFAHPGSLASHLSRLTFDAGDVTPLLV